MDCEVCVVGAGPAGLTVAQTLASAGRQVLLLESGGFGPSPAAGILNAGDARGEPYAGLRDTRHRQVGGTANIWNVRVEHQTGAKYVPLSPRDLSAWPIDWSDLEPFYREAQTLCGLGPFEYGAEAWTDREARPFDLRGTGLTSGVYQFGDAGRLTRGLVERLRTSEGARLVSDATVVGLELDASRRRALGVRFVHEPSGIVRQARADRVVLAAGAVENARLLLLAGVAEGTASAWLGRGFMEHARDFSLTLVPKSPDIFERAGFYDFRKAGDATWVGGRVSPTSGALEHFGLPAASLTLIPRADQDLRPSLVRRLLRRGLRARHGDRIDRYGWSTLPAPSRMFDVFGIVMNLEHLPDPVNRIELGTRRDRFGNALPRLVLKWTDREQERLEKLRELLDGWFRTACIGHVRYERGSRPDLSAHHHAGTTRMALRPEDGVADPDARVFGCENLYLAGASLFPTADWANPTLTIVALSLRLGRHLA